MLPLSASCSNDKLDCDVGMVALIVVPFFREKSGEDSLRDGSADRSINSSAISVPIAFVGHRTLWHQLGSSFGNL